MGDRKKRKKDHPGEVEIDRDEGVFTTGVVCKLLDIPVWVLKQLDGAGIVSPPRKKRGEARLYSKDDLDMVYHCWIYMREHGVKIAGLKIILRMERKLSDE